MVPDFNKVKRLWDVERGTIKVPDARSFRSLAGVEVTMRTRSVDSMVLDFGSFNEVAEDQDVPDVKRAVLAWAQRRFKARLLRGSTPPVLSIQIT